MKSLFRASILAGPASAIAIFASLSLCGTSLQAKGKPGGRGEDPPPDPDPVDVPFHYQITWHDGLGLRDVAPDGTVVGAFWPDGTFGSNIAIIRFPATADADGIIVDGFDVNLEDLLIDAEEIPGDWRVTDASEICDGLLVGVNVYDPDGRLYAGAIKLNAGGTLQWFSLITAPDGQDTFVRDATESGEFLIATGEISNGIGAFTIGESATLSVWNPSANTTLTFPWPVDGGWAAGRSGWWYSSISDYLGGSALIVDSVYDFTTPDLIPLPDSGTSFSTVDIGDDGTVLATIAGVPGTHHKRDPGTPSVLARWVPEVAGWETILNFTPSYGDSGAHPYVNSSGEIAGSTGGELFIFHDGYGLQSVNDMIDPSQASLWDTGADYLIHGLSDPIPEAPYSGVIVGRESGGSYFTLTPVPVSQP